jgi:hypothetical protein
LLAARGIPFVFVTGYGTESIDGRFAQVPVLQKPIERQVLEAVFVGGGRHNGADTVRDDDSYQRSQLMPEGSPGQTGRGGVAR